MRALASLAVAICLRSVASPNLHADLARRIEIAVDRIQRRLQIAMDIVIKSFQR